MKPGRTGLSRIVAATGYSLQGLRACFSGEAAFRQELLLVVVLLPVSFWIGKSPLEWIALVAPLLLLLIVELLNSAIEAVVDRVGAQPHPLSGRAKDMGSAAVLLSLLLVAASWIPLSYQHFREFL